MTFLDIVTTHNIHTDRVYTFIYLTAWFLSNANYVCFTVTENGSIVH